MIDDRFCPNCGHVTDPGDAFCGDCGINLETGRKPPAPINRTLLLAVGITGLIALVLSVGIALAQRGQPAPTPDAAEIVTTTTTSTTMPSTTTTIATTSTSATPSVTTETTSATSTTAPTTFAPLSMAEVLALMEDAWESGDYTALAEYAVASVIELMQETDAGSPVTSAHVSTQPTIAAGGSPSVPCPMSEVAVGNCIVVVERSDPPVLAFRALLGSHPDGGMRVRALEYEAEVVFPEGVGSTGTGPQDLVLWVDEYEEADLASVMAQFDELGLVWVEIDALCTQPPNPPEDLPANDSIGVVFTVGEDAEQFALSWFYYFGYRPMVWNEAVGCDMP